MPMPRVTLIAVPHSFLSNCPERGAQAPWGRGQGLGPSQPLHRRNTFVCMVGRSTFPWCQADGLESVPLPSLAVPASVPARLCVWHLKKQQLKILLADLLLQGQAPKQAQSQSYKNQAASHGLGQDAELCFCCPNQRLGQHNLRI